MKKVLGFADARIMGPSEPRDMPWVQTVDQRHAIGRPMQMNDGRVFHYAKNGAVALAAGELQQSALYGGSVGTVQNDLTPSAAAIGATTVYITTATDATVADLFAGGWLAVTDGGAAIGQGEMYKILSHTGGAAGLLAFQLDRPLITAWTSSTRISLCTNLYKAVIQTPVTTPSGLVLGVPMIPVTIAYFFWLQTWGMANVLIYTALTMGADVLLDVAAAGSAGVNDGILINSTIGRAGLVAATGDSGFVFLTIAA